MSAPHERLKDARVAAGFASAAEAADRFGWRYPSYSAHENGHRGLRPEAAARYAQAFGVDAQWLLFGRGKGAAQKPAAEPGLAEAQAEFVYPRSEAAATALRTALAPSISRPGWIRINSDTPSFGLRRGDYVLVDLQFLGNHGDIVAIGLSTAGGAPDETRIGRLVGSHVVLDDPALAPIPLDNANPSVGLRGAVQAVVRGRPGFSL